MTEPDVALSDYALFLLNAVFSWIIWRTPSDSHWLRGVVVAFFASISLAALTGGTVHGFFIDESSAGYGVLWPSTLLMVGLTASTIWVISALLSRSGSNLRFVAGIVGSVFLAYAFIVLFLQDAFATAIGFYLPPALILFFVLIARYTRRREGSVLSAVIGLGLTFVAAAVQQVRIEIHPRYFNYNSTYHLVQAVGLCLMFIGLKELVEKERTHA